MTDVKKTKKALIASVTALMLCVVMLLGTTYAWFTDSATVSGNKIQSGTLDIALEMWDGTKWVNAEGETLNFISANDETDILWEPGCTYQLPKLRVVNKGNLAAKYQVQVTGIAGDAKLNEAIKWFGYYEVNQYGAQSLQRLPWSTFASQNYMVTPAGETWGMNDDTSEFQIEGVMNKNAGNEYQGLTIEGVSITVVATQAAYEYDSKDNQYDVNAEYPEVTVVSSAADLKDALAAGGNIVLTQDIVLNNTLMTNKDVVIDLNGNAITAPSSGVMFQSQSNAAPSMIITSSTAGAEINAGSNAVLLGYGSTEISNVTINVENATSTSVPFSVYGDLTLGEGTVVNVDSLGTSLISNNGKVDIVIDGAEINIGTFKVNGGSVISLNQASTLKMKDTNVKIDEFVLSPFGGDSLVSKVNGVTINGCTFDVTDSNGASCKFVAKDEKYRLVQK